MNALLRLLLIALLVMPQAASACAVCFGNSDSPLAKALNWGILALLGVVLAVLAGIVAFFVHMAKRARTAQLTTTVTTAQEELQP